MDKCLPFGAAISCSHFQAFSDDVAHIVKFKTKEDLVNNLDDYLFVALLRLWCNQQVKVFMQVCALIHFPVSFEKTFWGCTCLTFLGLLIDSENQVVAVPVEKIEKALKLIEEILSKEKMTLKQLQKICGFLNFLGRAVVPGRAFTRRLYMSMKGYANLKPHHHISVKADMRRDLVMWQSFLSKPVCYARPFLDFDVTRNAVEISMYSDASKNSCLGFGGICQNSWVYSQWEKNFVQDCDPSIEYLELYAVVMTIVNWLYRFKNQGIVLFCDNQAVVSMIN